MNTRILATMFAAKFSVVRVAALPLLLLAAVVIAAPMAAPKMAPVDPDVVLLKAAGFDATRDSLHAYFQSLHPDEKARREVDLLVEQLGATTYRERAAASRTLARLTTPPPESLRRAAASTEPEVQQRAKTLVEAITRRSAPLRAAALRVVAAQRHKGFAGDAIEVLETTSDLGEFAAARRALVATAESADAERLRAALRVKPTAQATPAAANFAADARAAAVQVLHATLGAAAEGDLRPLLADSQEAVRLAAAVAVVSETDRAPLGILAELLNSEREPIRRKSHRALIYATGQAIELSSTADAAARHRTADAYREWLAGAGRSAKLRLPIEISDEIELFDGRTFAGWAALYGGQIVDPATMWTIDQGILSAGNKKGGGYLRTLERYNNYTLTLQWRMPSAGDSGVFVRMSGLDQNPYPRGLEVQLLSGNVGDFWNTENYPATVGGKMMGGHDRAARSGPANERPLGEWNDLEVTVLRGRVTVKVNGQVQNEATGCPNEPCWIVLLDERTATDFRNLRLMPLD